MPINLHRVFGMAAAQSCGPKSAGADCTRSPPLPTYPFREQDSAVRIVDAWTRPVREDGDPFGPIAAGSIRLIGTLVKLVYKRSEEFERQGWLGGARCTMTPDEEPFQENTMLCCLPLEFQPESVLGLVIELTGNAEGQYVRRGLIFSGVQ